MNKVQVKKVINIFNDNKGLASLLGVSESEISRIKTSGVMPDKLMKDFKESIDTKIEIQTDVIEILIHGAPVVAVAVPLHRNDIFKALGVNEDRYYHMQKCGIQLSDSAIKNLIKRVEKDKDYLCDLQNK